MKDKVLEQIREHPLIGVSIKEVLLVFAGIEPTELSRILSELEREKLISTAVMNGKCYIADERFEF